MQVTRLYRIWVGIRQRIRNPKATSYSNYGGRGITYTLAWETFPPFMEWALATGYSDLLSIERRDVNGNYCPENCYWANASTQAANKRKRQKAKHTYIGVRELPSGNWQAIINFQKSRLLSIGTFASEIEAAIKRDAYIVLNKLPHKLNF